MKYYSKTQDITKIHNIDVGQECRFSPASGWSISFCASCRNTGGTGPAGVGGMLLGREQHGDACSRSGLSSTLALTVHEAMIYEIEILQ